MSEQRKSVVAEQKPGSPKPSSQKNEIGNNNSIQTTGRKSRSPIYRPTNTAATLQPCSRISNKPIHNPSPHHPTVPTNEDHAKPSPEPPTPRRAANVNVRLSNVSVQQSLGTDFLFFIRVSRLPIRESISRSTKYRDPGPTQSTLPNPKSKIINVQTRIRLRKRLRSTPLPWLVTNPQTC